MDLMQRRSIGCDKAQDQHQLGIREHEEGRPAVHKGRVAVKVDLDETMVSTKSLKELDILVQSKAFSNMSPSQQQDVLVKVALLRTMQQHLSGGMVCNEDSLPIQLRETLQRMGGHAALKGFGKDWTARNYEFDLQLPKPDGSLSTEKFNIPMAFARDGYDVIMKLNPGIDRLIMERSGQVPLEQHIDREWGPWIMHKPNDDKGEWFVFMRLANNIPHFLDALFQVKVACEEEAGSTLETAAAASVDELVNTIIRIMTRNMRPSNVAGAIAAMDPEGRVFRLEDVLLCSPKPEAARYGKRVSAATLTNRYRRMPWMHGVIVGFDNNSGEMCAPIEWELEKGLGDRCYAFRVDDLDIYDLNPTDHYGMETCIAGLCKAAKAAGLPANLDLWQDIDNRTLQQRQLSCLSQQESVQIALQGIRRYRAAAAAAAEQLLAAAAAAAEQGATASRGSPIAVDAAAGSGAAVNEAPAISNEQQTNRKQKLAQKEEEDSFTPTDEKAEANGVVTKQQKPGTANSNSNSGADNDGAGNSSSSGVGIAGSLDAAFAAAGEPLAAAPAAAAARTVKPPSSFAAAIKNAGMSVKVTEEVQQLERSRLIAVYRDSKYSTGKVARFNTIIETLHVAFGQQTILLVEQHLQGLTGINVGNKLRKMTAVNTVRRHEFPAAWQLHLQQQDGLQLVRVTKEFAVAAVAGQQYQMDVEHPNLNRQPVTEWETADNSSRQEALNILLAAVVRSVLEGDPNLPAGLELFNIEGETVAAGITPSVAARIDATVEGLGGVNVKQLAT